MQPNTLRAFFRGKGTCSHCKGDLALTKPLVFGRIKMRCIRCHCRWDSQGVLLRWGLRCPRLVKVPSYDR